MKFSKNAALLALALSHAPFLVGARAVPLARGDATLLDRLDSKLSQRDALPFAAPVHAIAHWFGARGTSNQPPDPSTDVAATGEGHSDDEGESPDEDARDQVPSDPPGPDPYGDGGNQKYNTKGVAVINLLNKNSPKSDAGDFDKAQTDYSNNYANNIDTYDIQQTLTNVKDITVAQLKQLSFLPPKMDRYRTYSEGSDPNEVAYDNAYGFQTGKNGNNFLMIALNQDKSNLDHNSPDKQQYWNDGRIVEIVESAKNAKVKGGIQAAFKNGGIVNRHQIINKGTTRMISDIIRAKTGLDPAGFLPGETTATITPKDKSNDVNQDFFNNMIGSTNVEGIVRMFAQYKATLGVDLRVTSIDMWPQLGTDEEPQQWAGLNIHLSPKGGPAV